MNNLPVNTPAETLAISPEALEVANCYLQTQDLQETSRVLGISVEVVASFLDKREVKSYIDTVFMNLGFNNRHKLQSLMDEIIKAKLKELDEAEISTSKDILDILALKHKMVMDELDRQIQLEKIRLAAPKKQINVQMNDLGGGSNYSNLLERILKGEMTDV